MPTRIPQLFPSRWYVNITDVYTVVEIFGKQGPNTVPGYTSFIFSAEVQVSLPVGVPTNYRFPNLICNIPSGQLYNTNDQTHYLRQIGLSRGH